MSFSTYENSHLSYLFLFVFNHFIVLSFVEFQDLFYYWIMNDFMKHFQWPFIDFALPYMCVSICMYMCRCIYIYIYSFDIVAHIMKIFMFSVYMYISALYILFAPGSYTSHWLMFFVVNTTGNKAYLILSYLILSLALWKSYDCPRANEAILDDMGKRFI